MAGLEPVGGLACGLTFEHVEAPPPLALPPDLPNDEAAGALPAARQWRVHIEESVVGESGRECCVRVLGSGAKVVCCIPTPVYADRGAAFFAHLWGGLTAAGFTVLALDWPGQGRAGGSALSAKGARHGDLLLAILQGFRLKDVCVVADAGGAAAFIRAFLRDPDAFGAHHVLQNPIISKVPSDLMSTLCLKGTDLKIIFADGWGPTDNPFTIANCGQIFEFCGQLAPIADKRGPRIDMVLCIPPRGPNSISSPGIKPMRPEAWLHGVHIPDKSCTESRSKSFFAMVPSEECVKEFTSYLASSRRTIVTEDKPAAPTMSLLESGQTNESFKVFVRIRPMLQREIDAGNKACTIVEDVRDFPRKPPPQRVHVVGGRMDASFVFDRVFEPGTQEEVFEHVAAPLVEVALRGTNVTMFAYGQTGTGKTYTMEGPGGSGGLITQAVEMVFRGLGGQKKVYFQYVQLYNSQFTDLLNPTGKQDALAVEEGPNFMVVRAATIMPAASAQELLRAVSRGAAFRATGATNMNDASSRSHAILNVMLSEGIPEEGTSMCLVDLAGSERTKRSGVTGASFAEAVNINGALSALGRVVTSLVENDGKRAAHISYKDNALTYLLKSGVGGNAHTALVCCITQAADSLDESLNTLRFAAQASHVKNKVAKSESKAAEEAKAAKMAASANMPKLDADGSGTIPLSRPLTVCGCWLSQDGAIPVICINGFIKDDAIQKGVPAPVFDDGCLEALKAKFPRVLIAQDLVAKEKDPDSAVPLLLELLDWLGVAKAALWGRDAGAVLAGVFKTKHSKRVSHLFMENVENNVDGPMYKAIGKKDPNYCMGSMTGAWGMLFDWGAGGIKPSVLKVKGLNNFVMWPMHKAGNSVANNKNQKGTDTMVGLALEKALKTKVMDCHMKSGAEITEMVAGKLKAKKAGVKTGAGGTNVKASAAASRGAGAGRLHTGSSKPRISASASRAAERATVKVAGANGGSPNKAIADKQAKTRLAAAGRPPQKAVAKTKGASAGLPALGKRH